MNTVALSKSIRKINVRISLPRLSPLTPLKQFDSSSVDGKSLHSQLDPPVERECQSTYTFRVLCDLHIRYSPITTSKSNRLTSLFYIKQRYCIHQHLLLQSTLRGYEPNDSVTASFRTKLLTDFYHQCNLVNPSSPNLTTVTVPSKRAR